MRLKNFIVILLLASLSACSQKARPILKQDYVLSIDSLQRMNNHFHSLVDEKRLAGIQTAILHKGKLIQFDSYGYANMEEKILLDDKTIFRIFSMTKPIVSVALMQLYEQGKFRLEDPLHTILPDFKEMYVYSDSSLIPAKKAILIIDLLRHSSGLSYGRGSNQELNAYYQKADLNNAKDNKAYVQKLSTLPLQFEPGTDWLYGLNTNICGHLVEVLSGEDLDSYLKKHVLGPLQMTDTHFQLPKEKADRFTVGYRWDEEEGLFISEQQRENNYLNEVTVFNGGGGLVSTSKDYLNFCQMLLDKGQWQGRQILLPETVDLMLSDHLALLREQQKRFRLPLGETSFGLGFAIHDDGNGGMENVFGWGGAVGTYFKIDTEHDLAYVMMIQLSPYRQLGLRGLMYDYVKSSIQVRMN